MLVSSVLKGIGLDWDAGGSHAVLQLFEHESRTCSLPEGTTDAVLNDVSDILSGAIGAGLLTVEARRDITGTSRLVIETSSMVGFASSTSRSGGRAFVKVHPKVGTSRMLELAMLADMLPHWQPGGAHVSPGLDEALLEWTIGAFGQALRRLLARGGLRNTHERIRDDLKNRMRGRLLVGPWLRNVARGAPHVIPSEFPSLEFDNPANRMLRWAIHVGIVVARSLPHAGVIVERLRQADRLFAGVTLARPRKPLLDPRALPANLRHYTEAVRLAKLVLESVHLGSIPGEIEAMSIALDMNTVYERAFFNGLSAIQPDASRHDEWRVDLETPSDAQQNGRIMRSTLMIPDVWIEGDAYRLPVVIDTKWKNVLSRVSNQVEAEDLLPSGETRTVRLRPEDLYQATAYAVEALHRRTERGEVAEGCVVALVYPSLNSIPDLGREIRLGSTRVLVRIVCWNVANPVAPEIGAIWNRLQKVAERDVLGAAGPGAAVSA